MPEDILQRLTTLYPKAIEPGLERTLRVLKDIDNPHLKLPPVVHIAGTNGKGSTLAFIRAILEDAGKTCHVMTSPHLVKFNERLVITGQEITDEALEHLLTRVEKLNEGKPITFFEIVTAAGLLAFAENHADFCLLETGMGGRLDCTNVVPDPLLTIITNISLDHTQHLGNTLEKIAFEKAGIMKENVACIIGPQTNEALNAGIMKIFESRATELNVPLYRHGHEWRYEEISNGFTVIFEDKKYDCPKPNLLGTHQIANSATAIAGLISLNLPFLQTRKSFKAVTAANWPARLQKMISGNLYDLLPKDWELWLDGGHNEAGGKILGLQAGAWQTHDNKPLHLLLGMLTTKDPLPFYEHLKPYVTTATAIPIPDEELAFKAPELSRRLSISLAPDPETSIREIVKTAPKGRILIAGSLYLAGKILKSSR